MSDPRSSQKAQNLARIRDNQRRSRARRKEYLQELEIKLRGCEQVGIEASSEIQSAARKVLEENRKLRALLHERGVAEPEIVAALGGSHNQVYEQISAAPSLNAMLERRITYHSAASATSSPVPAQIRAASLPRHLPSAPPLSIPTSRPQALSCCDSLSPSSMVSSMGTPPPVSSYTTPFYPAPMTPASGDVKTEEVPYNYSYENTSYPANYGYDYSYASETPVYYSTTCGVGAANIIRTMNAEAAPELGYVNNSLVFDAMGKYAAPHSAI